MKTTISNKEVSQTIRPKAQKQASVNSILQAYKDHTVQRQSAEEEELLQGKFETVQKMDLDEEEPVQGKFETAQPAVEEEEPLQRKPNNTGLPDNLKSGIENLSGYSMDDVKVHYNSSQPATLQAHAYAQGTDIHIAPRQEKHLPHEAWHVIQQKQGRVKPTMQMKGTVQVNDDIGLEKEADVMGAKTFQVEKCSSKVFIKNSPRNVHKPNNKSKIVQGKFIDLKDMQLGKASPSVIGMEETYYAALWNEINDSEKEVLVLPSGDKSSYDSSTKALYFNRAIVDDLLTPDLESEVKVSHVATITHEMSHAHDHVIKSRELTGGTPDEHTKKVLETELRAWAREALSAYQAGIKLKAMDDEKGKLINGWINYEDSMLNDLRSYRNTNHIIGRLWIYIMNGINPSDTSQIVQWAKDNKEFIDEHASRLKSAIKKTIQK